MKLSKRDEMFEVICGMSDRQIDPVVVTRLRALMSKESVKYELLGLLDDIAHYSWASDFVISVLHIIWLDLGGTESELARRRAP